MRTINYFRKIALLAGAGYLIIFITGIYANFFVLENFIVDSDPVSTWENISGDTALFRVGLLAFIIMVLSDLVLTWALYILFRAINKDLSLFAAWFRLANCILFGVALIKLFDVLELITQNNYLKMPKEYLQTEVMISLSSFNYTWLLGLVLFGIHLLALGKLLLQSGFIPKVIGYLLLLAGVGYLIDSFAQFTMNNYQTYQDVFTMLVVIPGVVGELSFTIWLLLKGGQKFHRNVEST